MYYLIRDNKGVVKKNMSRKEYGESIPEPDMELTPIQKALAKRKAIADSRKNETAEQRSVRIANVRTNKVLKLLDELSRLGRSNYVLSSEQCEKILAAINGKMIVVTDSFNKAKTKQEDFKL